MDENCIDGLRARLNDPLCSSNVAEQLAFLLRRDTVLDAVTKTMQNIG
jgi:hypothetical protein